MAEKIERSSTTNQLRDNCCPKRDINGRTDEFMEATPQKKLSWMNDRKNILVIRNGELRNALNLSRYSKL